MVLDCFRNPYFVQARGRQLTRNGVSSLLRGVKTHTQGFSLLEFMLSLSLGLFLLVALLTFYRQLQLSYRFIMGLSEIPENAQVALAWISRDIRMTGFIGCPRLTEVDVAGEKGLTASTSVVGWHQSRSTSGQSIPISSYDKESDVIRIQFAEAESQHIQLAKKHHIRFQSSQKSGFKVDQKLLISDCRKAESFRWGTYHLRDVYGEDAELRPLRSIVYYVAKTSRKNQSGLPIYSLHRYDLNGPRGQSRSLVEGIEKMEIRYGVQTGGAALDDVWADAVSDWRQVKAVEIILRSSSIENVMSKPSQWKAMHKQQDRRLKREWRQVVMLRARET